MIDSTYTTAMDVEQVLPLGNYGIGLNNSTETLPEETHLNGEYQNEGLLEKDLTADNIDVNVVTLHDVYERFLPIVQSNATSPSNALTLFKQIQIKADNYGSVPLFTDFVDQAKKTKAAYSQLWVHIPQEVSPSKQEFYLNFRIDCGPFYSQFLEDSTSDEQFHYLSIYEDENEKPFIYLRLGNDGEILWLGKGNHLNGGSVKNLCLDLLQKAPFIPKCYLLDAAEISLRVQTKSCQKIEKVFLSMVLALTSDDGESWYGRSGFSPVKCQDLKIKGTVVDQQPTLYYQAVEKLRSLTWEDLQSTFKRYQARLKFVRPYVEKYFPEQNPTLHQIFKAVHGETKKFDRHSQESVEAETNLYQLYRHYLDPKSLKVPNATADINYYYLAIETLKVHTIWERSFVASGQVMSYNKFLSLSHESFDTTMSAVVSKRPFRWRLPSTY